MEASTDSCLWLDAPFPLALQGLQPLDCSHLDALQWDHRSRGNWAAKGGARSNGFGEKGGSAPSTMPGLHLPPLLPAWVDSGHPHLPASHTALWPPAHRPAHPLPGAILRLPVWGDAATENCFEDDVYWEVRREGSGRAGPAAGRGAEAGLGVEAGDGSGAEGAGAGRRGREAQDGAVAPRREGRPWRGAEGALPRRRCRRTRRATCTTCTTLTSPLRPELPGALRRPPRQGRCPLRGVGGAVRHLPACGAAPAGLFPQHGTPGPAAGR